MSIFVKAIFLLILYCDFSRIAIAAPLNNGNGGLVGVSVHYLISNKIYIYAFDVNGFVSDVERSGAKYVLFTLGQNNGIYNSYNPVLEKECDFYKNNQIYRDLVFEISENLKNKGIKFFLYLPIRSPKNNNILQLCLGDFDEREPPNGSFLKKWADVIGYWSSHLGTKLDGWWFDGAYSLENSDLSLVCDAAFRGNKNRLVAFNPGEGVKYLHKKVAFCQNWIAGEINNPISLYEEKFDFSEKNSMRSHIFTYVGEHWGRNGVRFNRDTLTELMSYLGENKTMFTLDVEIGKTGRLNLEQSSFIRNFIKNI